MPDRRVNVVLTANAGPLRAGLLRASAAVRQFGSDVDRVSRDTSLHTERIGRSMLVAGAVIATAFAGAVFAAARFEREMYNIATISDFARTRMDTAGNALIRMSTQLPQSAATLARGLYDVASSGFAGAEGLTVTEQSAKAASAGLSDTATAARAITGVLNAYGLGAQDARMVSDILFQTVNLGVITFEELAHEIGGVIGMASSAKVPIKDVGAALATITLAGIPAAEATTSLNRVIQSMLDPSEALQETLLNLGYATGEQALQSDGLQKVLTRVRKATGDSATEFIKLFPEIRAARGALALTSAEGENWRRVARGMDEATRGSGATARALEQQQKSLTFQLQTAKNAVVGVAIAFGQGLLPPLKFVAQAAKQVFMGFQEMPGPLRIVLQIAAALSAGILILGGGFLVLAPRIRDASAVLQAMGRSGQIASAGLRATSLALGVVGIALTIYAAVQGAGAKKQAEINDKANKYLDILRQTNGELTKAAENEARRNLAQNDSVKTARELGLTGKELVNIATQRNAADKIAAVTRRNIIALARQEGDDIDRVKSALDAEHSSQRELLLQGPQISDTIKDHIRSRLDLIDAVGNEREAIRRAIEIYQQETDTKDQSKKKSQEQKQALKEEEEMLKALGVAVDSAEGEVSSLTKVQQGLHEVLKQGPDPMAAYQTAVSAFRERTDTELGAAGEAWWRFKDSAQMALSEFLAEMFRQLQALAEWETNLGLVAQRGGAAFAAQLAKLGPEAAPLVAQIATATQPEFEQARVLFEESARRMGEGHAAELDKWLKISAAIGAAGGTATGKEIAEKTGLKLPEVMRIAQAYGITLIDAVNNVLSTLGGTPIPWAPGVTPTVNPMEKFYKRADGGIDPHIQRSPTILYGERETGGEAFIPLGKRKRARSEKLLATVAQMFGYGIIPMAVGGIADYLGRLPKVPPYDLSVNVQKPAHLGDKKKYDQAVWKVALAHAAAVEREASMTRGGGLASTVGLNPEFLRRFNEYNAAVGNKFRIVSGYRSRAQQAALYQRYLSGRGNLAAPPGRSQHEKGLAIDHAPNATGADMAIARRFRLHYPVRGEPWHVEPFDRGGYLQPGWTLAWNGTGQPERVVPPGGDRPVVINTTLVVQGSIHGDQHLRDSIRTALDRRDKQLADALRRRRQ